MPFCTNCPHIQCARSLNILSTSPRSTTFASTVQHGNASVSPVPRASPVAPSFPLPSPLPFHVDENLRSVPPLDNLHSTHQFIESFPVPITEPDRAMAGEIHDIVASGITASYPTPESFVSAPLGLFRVLVSRVIVARRLLFAKETTPLTLPLTLSQYIT
jgi:hypothetical protein